MEKQEKFPLPPPQISLVPLDEAQAANKITVVVDDPAFGRLTGVYEPDRARGTLARGFSNKLNDVDAVLHAHNYAFDLIREKIEENLRDAIEGMVREVNFQTYRDLNGHAFFGKLKSKEMMSAIRRWHASASGKRMGVHRGPQGDTMGFISDVSRAATTIEGRITQQKLADALGCSLRRLQQKISDNSYT